MGWFRVPSLVPPKAEKNTARLQEKTQQARLLRPVPVSLSLPLTSLPQVRSGLGTNILSAAAAFSGTAVLLMDFGVTSWVTRGPRSPQGGEGTGTLRWGCAQPAP